MRVYNTLTQQKEELVPLVPGKIGLYVCGPTVYSYIHIGNARTFTSFDVVARYLRYRGFEVRYVRNFTDVDDKIINEAKKTGEDPKALASRFIAAFEEDAKALHLIAPDVSPRVTDTMPEIIALVQELIARGVAYESKGDVYFQVSKYPKYARLSRRDLDEMKKTERMGENELKREPLDFALWKAAKPDEPAWDSPWGKGRPGWHIECSAMSSKYIGTTLDLHAGGVDLIFPHHENEIAQSEAASGETFCKVWMHGGFLDLEGAKMSKSLGNVKNLRDALGVVDAEALRYFFLSTHYRAQIAFSDKSLGDAEARMQYFYETLRKVDERIEGKEFIAGPLHGDPAAVQKRFEEVMDDDFNFAGGLGVLSELFATMNELTDKPPVKDKPMVGRTLVALREIVRRVSVALGLFEDKPAEWLSRRRDRLVQQRGIDRQKVEALIEERKAARAAKDFKRSDAIRDEAKAMGVEIMDTPQGTDWKVT